MNTKKVVLIGLDAAEWTVIHPLLEAGMMPNIKKLIENGVSGNIKTLNPPFSPMLWTSVATGKTAEKHGILGFLEPNVEDGTVQPINNTSRKCRALWNIFHHKNIKSNVIGWWPSHPAEPINGIMVSNRFQKAVADIEKAWPMVSETINIPDGSALEELRLHPQAVPAEILRVFVPDLEKVDQKKDNKLSVIRKLLAETLCISNAAKWSMEKNDWNFTAVYFNELDQFSHHFMPFHPPQQTGIPQEKYDLYKNVLTAVYTFYDTLIGELVTLAGEEANIILLSDHGFYSGSKRIRKIPAFTAGIALEHNPYGVLCMAGPDFKKKEEIQEAGLLDIAPTILTLFGLPVGKDMDGKILTAAFKRPVEPAYINSWEEEAGDFGEHDKKIRKDSFSEQQALQQMMDLGYIEKLDEDKEEQLRKVLNDANYNLSIVYYEKGEISKAIELLEKLYEDDLVDVRYNLDLINYYPKVNQIEKAKKVLASFRKFDISNLANFDFLEGKLFLKERKKEEALVCFKKALISSPGYLELQLQTAYLYNRLKKYNEAEQLFLQILENNNSRIEAHHGLVIGYNRSEQYDKAIEAALKGIEIDQKYAPLHYHLGEAFYRVEEYEASAQVLETCLRLNPSINRARNLLMTIYTKHCPDPQKYDDHFQVFKETRKGEIVVVSGLPRSGTSMMMQLLQAGGMEILQDELRLPDESNPKGYFEFEPVKSTRKDNSWMNAAEGKAVKVIAQLLPKLQLQYSLKVIFMERDLKEVLMSQAEMISRNTNNPKAKTVFDLKLYDTFQKQLEEIKDWAEERNNIEILYVDYKNIIENPAAEIRELNNFLGWKLNEDNMQNIVSPELYRIRS